MVLEIKNQNGGKKIKLEDLLSKNLDSTEENMVSLYFPKYSHAELFIFLTWINF